MATLYEYYNTNDDSADWIFGNQWMAMLFTVGGTAHTITSVKLKMYRTGSPGTLTVSIRNVSGGKPSGSDLTSGTTNANNFTTDSNGAWYEITLTEYTLSANTQYAIVCRVTGSDQNNRANWRGDFSSPTYDGGYECYSSNGGSSWYTYTSSDFMFEVYGNSLAPAGGVLVQVM